MHDCHRPGNGAGVGLADEPTTALDSINQGQVLEEFQIIRQKIGTALIFISHDLGVVKHLSDQLLVMKDGVAVEYGDAVDIFKNPRHAYTRYLIDTRLELTHAFQRAMKKRRPPWLICWK